MKKIVYLLAVFAMLFSVVGCNNDIIPKNSNNLKTEKSLNEPISIEDKYIRFLSDNYKDAVNLNYTYRDIDNNGTEELLIIENTTLTVYTASPSVTKIGMHDFITGTYQLLYSENKTFPGLIVLTVGGGTNHFDYITIQKNALSIKKIYDEDYSGISGSSDDKITLHSDNKELINAAQNAYKNNLRLNFFPYNKNDWKLFSVLKSEESFILKEDKKVFLNDFHSDFSENYTPSSYVFIDLDKDYFNELVVYANNGNSYLIFHNFDNNIYGYELPVRSFSDLKTDGTFMISQGALLNEFASISFDNYEYKIKTLAKAYYQASDSESVFEINNKSVSKDAIEKFTDEWIKKEDVSWINYTN